MMETILRYSNQLLVHISLFYASISYLASHYGSIESILIFYEASMIVAKGGVELLAMCYLCSVYAYTPNALPTCLHLYGLSQGS